MKRWPDFNDNGDLPPGIHQATLNEVWERFGAGTAQRRTLARRLERIYSLTRNTGHVAHFIIFGSFATAKPEPGDVDVFLLMDDEFEAGQLSGEVALIFDHTSAQNYEGASIFWLRRLAILDSEEETMRHWQLKRDGTRRGIVEVIEND